MIKLADLSVKQWVVLELATMLRRNDYGHTADTLEGAAVTNQTDIALTIGDCVAILNVLDDPPEALSHLRGVLLRDLEPYSEPERS